MSATEVAEQTGSDPTAIRPFQVDFPEAELTELRRRVNATRWPEPRDGHRRLAGRAARDDAGARALLGHRLRLAQVRGETERPAELRHRDRRAGHSFHSRSLPARGRAAADRHARVARLDHRAAEDHRAAHQPHGAWRERIGRVPSGDSLAAGPRVLRQADGHGMGSGTHRTCLGGADEAPRIRPGSWPRAAIGARRSRRRWARRPLRSCSASTPTCRVPLQPISSTGSSTATRRHPVSQPRSDARTSS